MVLTAVPVVNDREKAVFVGRTASGAFKDKVIATRVTLAQLQWIDSKRGSLSRAEWIRAVILREMRRG